MSKKLIGMSLFCILTDTLELGADTNTRDEAGETPLHLACRLGLKKLIKMLIDAGAKLDISGQNGTPIDVSSEETRAYISSRTYLIVRLIAIGILPDSPTKERLTQFQSHKWEVDMSKVEWLGEIGQGGFGTVFRGRWQGLEVKR